MARALNPQTLLAVPEGELSPAAERLAREYLTALGTTTTPDAPAAPEPAPAESAPAESAGAPDSPAPDSSGAAAQAVHRFSRDHGPMWLLGIFYVVMVGISIYGQTDGIIRWRHLHQLVLLDGALHIPARGLALIPAAAIELLAAVLFTFADWRRSVKYERALAARALALVVAAGVAWLNWAAHADLFDQTVFVGASLSAFAVVVLHTGARRRDAHQDQVKRNAPEYGLAQWLTAPRVTGRARQLALAVPDDEVTTSPQASRSGSLALAARQLADEAQARLDAQRARETTERIVAALGAVIDKSVDPVTARLALASFDLSAIARQVAAGVDNTGMAALLAADLTPDQLTAQAPAETRKARERRRRRSGDAAAPAASAAAAPAALAASAGESGAESRRESGAPDSARRVNRDAARTDAPRRTRRTGSAAPAAPAVADAPAPAAPAVADAPAPAASDAGESAGTVTKLDPEYDTTLAGLLRGWTPDDGPNGDWCTEHDGCGKLPSQRQAMAELRARGHRVGLKRAGKAVELAHQLDRTRPDAREATG